ncbi:MAG: M1 family aminopeptidase [Bacteroidota bacterium]
MTKIIIPFLFLFPIFIIACKESHQEVLENGVSKILADQRKSDLSEVNYSLHFSIPDKKTEPIKGINEISFHWAGAGKDLVLDFKNEADQVLGVWKGEESLSYRVEAEHILIDGSQLSEGKEQIKIAFVAGEQALNRNEAYLYTLFVPDKASTAFPCFDQPNIKATYKLSLEVPESWNSVANYSLEKLEARDGGKRVYQYKKTTPISTYIFAFAAGEFQKITKEIDGREMNLYHRETDEEKIKRNAPEVFDLHAKSLAWLEEYTGIPYPFEKFDFVLIPAFQFGGMEHAGAIYYRDRSLFLEKNASINQKMSRNSLISHETAHMWFGDLVTMDWFNDVWLKEVFANFMAAKMVNPNFPEIDHNLRFLQRHQPAAYGEDRTAGTHPIQQELENLNQASLLYGRIIYQKAPVVMKQLEDMMGEEVFQEGIREYLQTFSWGNATWDDLIGILDKKIDRDLYAWSQAWVKESGMPHFKAEMELADGKISTYKVSLQNKSSGGSMWEENSEAIAGWGETLEIYPINLRGNSFEIDTLRGRFAPDFVLPNHSEKAYGYFELDERSKSYLLENVEKLPNSFSKLVAWQALWEGMLRGNIAPMDLLSTIRRGLPEEDEQLGLSSRLGYLRAIYWGFLNGSQRKELSRELAEELRQLMDSSKDRDKKKSFYDALVSVSMHVNDVGLLLKIWEKKESIEGLELSENDFTNLAYELALRGLGKSDEILKEQMARIENPDRKEAIAFISPALSLDPTIRASFFESLKDPKNRQKEPWINQALGYLNHPLVAKESEAFLRPGLELVEELQKTNGIFFPKSWTVSLLSGHSSSEAQQILTDFINTLPETYSNKLKNKILQAGDMLKRKSTIKEKAGI